MLMVIMMKDVRISAIQRVHFAGLICVRVCTFINMCILSDQLMLQPSLVSVDDVHLRGRLEFERT